MYKLVLINLLRWEHGKAVSVYTTHITKATRYRKMGNLTKGKCGSIHQNKKKTSNNYKATVTNLSALYFIAINCTSAYYAL